MNVIQLVANHEGFRPKPYTDTAGKLTIGYGRNLTDKGITVGEAAYLLINDIGAAREWLREQNWYFGLCEARQAAVIDMVVNLGREGFEHFTKLIDALYRSDYERAAMEMLSSEWAKQVGFRAHEDARIMQRGAFPPFD